MTMAYSQYPRQKETMINSHHFIMSSNAAKLIKVAIATIALLTVAALFMAASAFGADWLNYFRPAALNLSNPYVVPGIFNPPWLFVILAPLAHLPPRIGVVILATFTLVVIVAYTKSAPKAIALALSAPAIATLQNGQIDALCILALAAPVWASLPLLMMKPQGVFLAGLRRLNHRSIAVLLTVLAISFLIWGLWPLAILDTPQILDSPWNCSFFPESLVLTAIILAWLKFHPTSRYADALLCLASLAATPYFVIHSALPTVALFIKNTDNKITCFLITALSWGLTLWIIGR